MTSTTKNKPTVIERAREDLVAAIAKLRTEQGWQDWIRAKARMHTYSANNQLLIWTQAPEATIVRGRRQWEDDFHRQLVAGAKPIWILAPRTKKLDEIDPDTGQNVVRRWFKGVRVYDVADTAQIPGQPEVPLEVPIEKLEGDSHRSWIVALQYWAATECNVSSAGEDLSDSPANGYFDEDNQRIVWDKTLAPNHQVKTLVHEIAHALGIRYSDEGGRSRAEACAEAAAYIACAAIGLDTSSYSVGYIAHWADDAEEIIENDIKRIDRIAGAIANCRKKKEPK